MTTPELDKSFVFDVNDIGGVTGFYDDTVNIGFLGSQEVSRASEIMFNAETQSFDVILAGMDKPVAVDCKNFPTYELGRRFEVAWLNGCKLAGVEPNSDQGVAIAASARAKLDDGFPLYI